MTKMSVRNKLFDFYDSSLLILILGVIIERNGTKSGEELHQKPVP
jgi:hypothetical protein